MVQELYSLKYHSIFTRNPKIRYLCAIDLIPTYLDRVVGQCSPDAHWLVLSRVSQGAGGKVLVQNTCGFVFP